jgi:tetrapyrrole methylase family protein / MazG family protein
MNADWKENAARQFERLLGIMERLRAPDGCPWDREQDLKTLRKYLIEETYEVLDAIDRDDPRDHCGELGDLLLQVVFQAEIRRQQGQFDAGAVCAAICEKLVRRHPHIFSDVKADTANDVLRNWEAIKVAERQAKAGAGQGGDALASALDGVPRSMPQLQRTQRLAERAARLGFDWPSIDGVLDKISEEVCEWQEAVRSGAHEHIVHELGDLIMALCNAARHLKIDPEDALAGANDRFVARFKHVEQRARESGTPMQSIALDRLESWWQEAKGVLRKAED